MATTTALVCLAAIFCAYRVLLFALRRKGDVRAGGQIGKGSFFIEVKDRKSG
jgi:hypothetical protein